LPHFPGNHGKTNEVEQMTKLDGIIVPTIMGLVLTAGVTAAVMLTRSNEPEPVAEVEAPRVSGVLRSQDTLRLKTKTTVASGETATRGFVQVPTSE
jgi:hypothetical protein